MARHRWLRGLPRGQFSAYNHTVSGSRLVKNTISVLTPGTEALLDVV